MTWTAKHERRLETLNEETVALREQRALALEALSKALNAAGVRDYDESWLLESFVKNADAIRDALDPFDSGVRAGNDG